MKIFVFSIIFFQLLKELLGDCLVNAPSNQCYFCKDPTYTTQSSAPFASSTCVSKQTGVYSREVLIVAGSDVTSSDWPLSDRYLAFDQGLMQESTASVSYLNCQINFYLTKGNHYLFRNSFSNIPNFLFRRSSCSITIGILLCSKKNIVGKCFDPAVDGGLTPTVFIKTNWVYFFVSTSLSISNIYFDGSDIVYPTGSTLTQTSACYNSQTVCCSQASLESTPAANPNCGLKGKALTASFSPSFCLFNVESFPEKSPYILASLSLTNVEFHNFWLVNTEGGFFCLIRTTMTYGNTLLASVIISNGIFLNSVFFNENDSAVVDSTFYNSDVKTLVAAIPNNTFSAANLIVGNSGLGVSLINFNYLGITSTNFNSLFVLNTFFGKASFNLLFSNCTLIANSVFLFSFSLSKNVEMSNLTILNGNLISALKAANSTIQIQNFSLISSQASSNVNFFDIQFSNFSLLNSTLSSSVFSEGKYFLYLKNSISSLTNGSWKNCIRLALYQEFLNLTLTNILVFNSSYQNTSLIRASRFSFLITNNMTIDTVSKGISPDGIFNLISDYSSFSTFIINGMFVTKTSGLFLYNSAFVNVSLISNLNISNNTDLANLWPQITFYKLTVQTIEITNCSFQQIFQMDESIPHQMNFTDFKIRTLNLTGWVFFFYSNVNATFNNLDFNGLVMKTGGYTYLFVTLQASSTSFNNLTCINCGYLNESPTYLANQAEMSLVAGWMADTNTYRNFTILNTGVKVNFNGGIFVHITIQIGLYLSNVTIDSSYNINDNFVYRGLTLTNPTVVDIRDSRFSNMRCPDTPQWRTATQYVNGAIFVYDSFSYAYSPNSKTLTINNISLSNCTCAVSGGGITILNYHRIMISTVIISNSKADKGGQIALFSSTNVSFSNLFLNESKAGIGSSIYVSVVNGPLIFRNITLSRSFGNLTGAFHILNAIDFQIYDSLFSDCHSLFGNAGGFYLESTKALIQNVNMTKSDSIGLGGGIMASACPNISINSSTSFSLSSGSGGFLYADSTPIVTILNVNLTNSSANFDGGAIYAYDAFTFLINNVFMNIGKSQTGMIFFMSFTSKAQISLQNFGCNNCVGNPTSCLTFESPSSLQVSNFSSNFGNGITIDTHFFYSFNFNVTNLNFSNEISVSSIFLVSMGNFSLNNFQFLNCSAINGLFYIENSADAKLSNGNFTNCGQNTTSNFASNIIFSKIVLQSISIQSSNSTQYKLSSFSLLKSQATLTNINMSGLYSHNENGIIYCSESVLISNSLSCINSIGPCLYIDSCSLLASSLTMANNNQGTSPSSDVFMIGNSVVTLNNFQSINSNGTSIFGFNSPSLSILDSSFSRNFQWQMKGISLLNVKTLEITRTSFLNLSSDKGAGVTSVNSETSTNFISLLNSKCTNSRALIGACIFLSGIHSSRFNGNSFINNTVDLNIVNLESGIGGSIMDSCPNFNNTCSFDIANCTFSNNFAAKLAPNIFTTSSKNSFNNLSFSNNNQTSISNVSQYSAPFSIKFLNQSETVVVASGQESELSFAFVDKSGQNIAINSSSSGNLVPLSQDASLENQLTLLNPNGKFTFSKFVMKYAPNSSTIIKFSFTLLMPELFLTTSPTLLETNFTFLSRECYQGEIFILNECRACILGTYSLLQNPLKQPPKLQNCLKCPENTKCLLNYILPDEGYWKFSENSTSVLACLVPGYCIGGIPVSQIQISNLSSFDSSTLIHGRCSEGHTGTLCNSCVEGYGKLSPTGFCQKCDNNQILIAGFRCAFILLAIVIYIVVMSRIFSNKKRNPPITSFIVKLLINHFQVLSIVSFSQIGFNMNFLTFTLQFADILNFRIEYFSSDCLLQQMGSNNSDLKIAEVATSLVFPVILSFIALITWFLVFILSKTSKKNTSANIYQKRILISFVVSIYLFYPLIIGNCFSLLNCISLNEGVWVLFSEPELKCWENPHSQYLIEASLPGLLIWGACFPVVLFIILRKQQDYNKRSLNKSQSQSPTSSEKKGDKKVVPKVAVKKIKAEMKENITKPNPQEFSIIKSIENIGKPNKRYSHLDPEFEKKIEEGEKEAPQPENDSQIRSKTISSKMFRMLFEEEILSFFYDGFKSETIYWESLNLFKKLLLSFISSLTQLLPPVTRNTIFMLILFFFFSSTIKCRPYNTRICNYLDFFSHITLLVTIFFAVINFQIVNYSLKLIFGAIVLLVNVAFLAILIILIFASLDFTSKFIFKNKRMFESVKLRFKTV